MQLMNAFPGLRISMHAYEVTTEQRKLNPWVNAPTSIEVQDSCMPGHLRLGLQDQPDAVQKLQSTRLFNRLYLLHIEAQAKVVF